MSIPVRIQSPQYKIWFEGLPKKLSEAVDRYNLPNVQRDWAQLNEVGDDVRFEGINVHADSAVIDGNDLIAPASVYVTIPYSNFRETGDRFSDSFPARVFFKVNRQNGEPEVEIVRIEIDTSYFT